MKKFLVQGRLVKHKMNCAYAAAYKYSVANGRVYFDTLEEASDYCDDIENKTRIILGVKEIEK